MTEYAGKDITSIPKKWNKEIIVYDKTYKWMIYKPNKERTLITEPCLDCSSHWYS